MRHFQVRETVNAFLLKSSPHWDNSVSGIDIETFS